MDSHISSKLQSFFELYPSALYKKGEIILKAQENPSAIHYIQSGMVRQYAISTNGDEMTLNIYKPCAFFPMMWALNDTPNRYYFEAMEQTTIYKAPRHEVINFLKKEPELLLNLTSRLFKALDGLLSKMEYLMTGNAHAKVIFTLLNTAYRFGQKHEPRVDLTLHMTHRELAALAGITRETCTRELKKLEAGGYIVVTNHAISIPDIHRLEEEISLG